MGIKAERRNDLTVMTVTGRTEAGEVIRAIDDWYAGSPTTNILWDFSEAELEDVEVAEVNRIAQTARKYADRRKAGRTALVFSKDVGYGLGRMFGTLQEVRGSGVRYRSFRTYDEALSWLESPPEEDE